MPWDIKSREERFWDRVEKRGECWLWKGYVYHGQPQFSVGDRTKISARRAAFKVCGGEFPKGIVRPSCGNPRCVRPLHCTVSTGNYTVLSRQEVLDLYVATPDAEQKLTALQHRRLTKWMSGMDTLEEIAASEGCSKQAVWMSVLTATNKLRAAS